MIQPTAFGRRLPRNDWEGDDFTPGAGGHFVTCQDTAVGRAVAWATNGRVDRDGRVYRAAVRPADPDGITLAQAAAAVRQVTHDRLTLVIPDWTHRHVATHLRYGRGLVVNGYYGALPRAYRHQARADFNHAMWVSHQSRATGNVRLWDPLNPDTTAYGRWVPAQVIWDFLESLGYTCAYVPLQPL